MSNNKIYNEFQNYYYKYLNYNKKDNIISSKQREKDINNFYYPIIVAMYDNKIIYSISSIYYLELKAIIKKEKPKSKEEIEGLFDKYFKSKNKKIKIQEMFRMTKKEKEYKEVSEVINIKEENKEEYFNSFDYHKEKNYKENKWEKIKKYKYLNGIIKDNKIVSLGFVSDIVHNAANIVIETKEKYQNKGYGKAIVQKISNDLLNDGIIPIYWVNINNKPSINLAKKLGFEVKALEIVVKIDN